MLDAGGPFLCPKRCWRPPDEGRVGPLIAFGFGSEGVVLCCVPRGLCVDHVAAVCFLFNVELLIVGRSKSGWKWSRGLRIFLVGVLVSGVRLTRRFWWRPWTIAWPSHKPGITPPRVAARESRAQKNLGDLVGATCQVRPPRSRLRGDTGRLPGPPISQA